ncbi:MAG: 30S ribosomal protein S6 [Alphaproteobacteria bacterium]|nr:30S ribosomal protein S6 [Alphaproteobacteria bacterium]
MPYYETVFIARQDLTEAQVKDLTEQFSKIITDNGGKIHKTENWGLRMLAYRINKSRKGHYVLIEVDAPSDAVIELERVMRLNEDVIRSLTIRQNQLSDEPSIMVEKASDKDDNKKFKYSKEKKEEAA